MPNRKEYKYKKIKLYLSGAVPKVILGKYFTNNCKIDQTVSALLPFSARREEIEGDVSKLDCKNIRALQSFGTAPVSFN